MDFLTDPWAWWIEPFSRNEFMRDALLAGVLTVITTSLVGTWVVLRGMSFLGDALAHGVLPGIAIAFIIGVDTSIGALAAAGCGAADSVPPRFQRNATTITSTASSTRNLIEKNRPDRCKKLGRSAVLLSVVIILTSWDSTGTH